ncbi:TRAP transporter permease [Oceanibaculum indicum]|uniref:TRAP transporter 4TM/12TM fusion protein n=1 Tax=Oceanibaculum indicum P24 TaxID=1207063 RepID=K2J1H6_9PROT|nr:TRAP transporter fused permease subunit [Oceanibaculum indicum]EKE76816.1 TRAP transporter 4TM/12TM fusion protein [Oceanibaculum indicum P24]
MRISWKDGMVLAVAALSVGFHLYLIFSGLMPNLVTRPLHLMLAIPFIFFFGVQGGPVGRGIAYATGAIGLAAGLYIVANREPLADQYGALSGWLQHGVAIVLILLALEMARRTIKAVLPAIAVLVLAYGLLGKYIPGTFGHDGIPLDYFLGTLVIAEGGLWGDLTGISAEIIAPFIILGCFISAGEAGTGFMSFATQFAGRMRAGAAKVSIVASALYGTISGSASANTASTGTVTIPAMKKLGYPPSFAAAVEAVASTGGQIMPPLMGAGVFVMAELLRTPYTDLMILASLPAFLFFLAAWAGVHFYAIRHGLTGMRGEDLPGWGKVARTVPFFLLPFGLLVVLLLFTRYTAPYAAAMATALTVVLLLIDSEGCASASRWVSRVAEGTKGAAEQIASIAAILICASLIVGVFHMTGLGVKITSVILSLSGGELWPALLLTALASLVLGMELPTTAAYVICIAVAGPALVQLGLPELYAHMFVFWYALLCTITPPVCGNVFIAAGIANTPWLPVAGNALRLGVGLFLVPLGFIANPSLLLVLESPVLAFLAMAKVGLGIWLLSFVAIDMGRRPLPALGALVGGVVLLFFFGV